MNFINKKDSILSTKDRLILNKTRLESSEYIDDKMDALYNIKEISEIDIFIVGVHALDTIIKSIEDTKNFAIQKEILLKILTSPNRNEFTEILLKKEANIKVLFSVIESSFDIFEILCSRKGRVVYEIIKRGGYLHDIVLKIEYTVNFLKYTVYDDNKTFFVYEGVIERLLGIINKTNHKMCIECLSLLVKDSAMNQNYFMEVKWMKLAEYKPYDLFVNILDSKNNNLKRFQDILCRKGLYDMRRCDLIYRLMYNNPKNYCILEDDGFKIEVLIKRLRNDLESSELYHLLTCIEEALKYTDLTGQKSYNINDNKFRNNQIAVLDNNIKQEIKNNNFEANNYKECKIEDENNFLNLKSNNKDEIDNSTNIPYCIDSKYNEILQNNINNKNILDNNNMEHNKAHEDKIINNIGDVLNNNSLEGNAFFLLTIIYNSHLKHEITKLLECESFSEEIIFLLCKLKEMKDIELTGYFIFLIFISQELRIEDNLLLIIKEYFEDLQNDMLHRYLAFFFLVKIKIHNEIIDYNTEFIKEHLRELIDMLNTKENNREYFVHMTKNIKDKLINEICVYRQINDDLEYIEEVNNIRKKQEIEKEFERKLKIEGEIRESKDGGEKESKLDMAVKNMAEKEEEIIVVQKENANSDLKSQGIKKFTSIFKNFHSRMKNNEKNNNDDDIYDL